MRFHFLWSVVSRLTVFGFFILRPKWNFCHGQTFITVPLCVHFHVHIKTGSYKVSFTIKKCKKGLVNPVTTYFHYVCWELNYLLSLYLYSRLLKLASPVPVAGKYFSGETRANAHQECQLLYLPHHWNQAMTHCPVGVLVQPLLWWMFPTGQWPAEISCCCTMQTALPHNLFSYYNNQQPWNDMNCK